MSKRLIKILEEPKLLRLSHKETVTRRAIGAIPFIVDNLVKTAENFCGILILFSKKKTKTKLPWKHKREDIFRFLEETMKRTRAKRIRSRVGTLI